MLTNRSGRTSLPPSASVSADTHSDTGTRSTYLHPPLRRPRHSTSYGQPRPISVSTSAMSRTTTNRPTHIPLPNSPFNGRSPNGSPLPTPSAAGAGAASPTSPRSSFIPSFIRTRSRAATLTGAGRGRSSPSAEVANPLGTSTAAAAGAGAGAGAGSRLTPAAVGVTRSVSTPQSGGLSATGKSSSSSFLSLSTSRQQESDLIWYPNSQRRTGPARWCTVEPICRSSHHGCPTTA